MALRSLAEDMRCPSPATCMKVSCGVRSLPMAADDGLACSRLEQSGHGPVCTVLYMELRQQQRRAPFSHMPRDLAARDGGAVVTTGGRLMPGQLPCGIAAVAPRIGACSVSCSELPSDRQAWPPFGSEVTLIRENSMRSAAEE